MYGISNKCPGDTVGGVVNCINDLSAFKNSIKYLFLYVGQKGYFNTLTTLNIDLFKMIKQRHRWRIYGVIMETKPQTSHITALSNTLKQELPRRLTMQWTLVELYI